MPSNFPSRSDGCAPGERHRPFRMMTVEFLPGAARNAAAACATTAGTWRAGAVAASHWSSRPGCRGPGGRTAASPADSPEESKPPSRFISAGSTLTVTPASSPSSRSSLVVNLACAGPRRPITCTSRTLRRAQRGHHRLGDVGLLELGRVAGQDAGHVDGDVADADHRDRLRVQGERVHVDVGVAAVPVDEVGGRVAARQVLAGDGRAGGRASRRSRTPPRRRRRAGPRGSRPWPRCTPPRNRTPGDSRTRRR